LENVLSLFNDKLTWIAGVRADRHNHFGWQFTPRTLLKFDPSPKLTLRANIGLGWRTVNLFSENVGLLASSRDVVITEKLRPEKALNAGINITQKFDGADVSGYISADFYHTDFSNQIFPDYDSNPTKAIVKNLDVYRVVNGNKEVLPFTARHKFLTTLSSKAINNKLHIDANLHWFGKQRLPNTKSNPAIYQRPDFSRPYTTVAMQLTYDFKTIELYGGCENIFDFRQVQPILSWQDPFSNYFDISSVWGPTRGRELYLGARWKLKKSKAK
jgi:outer membrane receptor for ferrienterochelin and colicins